MKLYRTFSPGNIRSIIIIIFQDYTKEYQRTNSTIKSRKERQQLLSSGRNGTELMTGLSRRDMYLKVSTSEYNTKASMASPI